MSEYQRYEFMAVERPLTPAQLEAVNSLSSHIEASSTHAVIEYHWGDFKHDPIKVLQDYFDGFLYWANWGNPQLAFRFPHGMLPNDLIDGYDFEDIVTFRKGKSYDILDIHFTEMEAPDEWTAYELGALIPIRDELLASDLRSLYIVWLASYPINEGYNDDDEADEDEDEEQDDDDYVEDYEVNIPAVPPGFARLTAAQRTLAGLLQVGKELLAAAGRHSSKATAAAQDDFATWIELLPAERRTDYLLRLAQNEPGLSRQFVRELRELGKGTTTLTPPTGERVPYDMLAAESKRIRVQLEQEEHDRQRLARFRHLQEVHAQQEQYWRQIEEATSKTVGARYEEAVRMLVELRDAAAQFEKSREFQARFQNWVREYLHRPGLLSRLRACNFTW